MSDEQLIQITQHGDLTVVHPATVVNERFLILEFTDQLLKFVEEEKPAKLQVNFEYVKYFSSEAFNALIRAQKRITANGGKMNLCGLNKDLRMLFKACALDGPVFKIYDTGREATEALSE